MAAQFCMLFVVNAGMNTALCHTVTCYNIFTEAIHLIFHVAIANCTRDTIYRGTVDLS